MDAHDHRRGLRRRSVVTGMLAAAATGATVRSATPLSTDPPEHRPRQRSTTVNDLARLARAEVLFALWDAHGWPDDRPALLAAAWVEEEIARLRALPLPGQGTLF